MAYSVELKEKVAKCLAQGEKVSEIAAKLCMRENQIYYLKRILEQKKTIKENKKEVVDEVSLKYDVQIMPEGITNSSIFNYRKISQKEQNNLTIIELEQFDGNIQRKNIRNDEFPKVRLQLLEEVISNAELFYEANKGRNLPPKFMNYMKVCEVYFNEKHQKNIEILINKENSCEQIIKEYEYSNYVFLNLRIGKSMNRVENSDIQTEKKIEKYFKDLEKRRLLEERKHEPVKAGDLYWLDFSNGMESEKKTRITKGRHPYVVITADEFINHSTVLTVVPLTSSDTKSEVWNVRRENNPFFVKVTSLKRPSFAIINQARVVDAAKLTYNKKYFGSLSQEELQNVRIGISKLFGINTELSTKKEEKELKKKKELEKEIEMLKMAYDKSVKDILTLVNTKEILLNSYKDLESAKCEELKKLENDKAILETQINSLRMTLVEVNSCVNKAAYKKQNVLKELSTLMKEYSDVLAKYTEVSYKLDTVDESILEKGK